MGMFAEVLSFARRLVGGVWHSEVTGDPGGGANVTVVHLADCGDDSQPFPTDFMATEDSPGAGRKHVVGYDDPKLEKVSEPGGKRILSRSAPGVVSAELHLQPNGRVLLKIHTNGMPLEIENEGGPVTVKSSDVRLGDGPGGRKVACIGDIVSGSVGALCGSPGSPIVPMPPAAPTATGKVPFVGKIISSCQSVSAGS